MFLDPRRLEGDLSLGKAGDDFIAYSVRPGDTLWKLACHVYGTHDSNIIQKAVEQIGELNELSSVHALTPGQLLIFSTRQTFDPSMKSQLREIRSQWDHLSLTEKENILGGELLFEVIKKASEYAPGVTHTLGHALNEVSEQLEELLDIFIHYKKRIPLNGELITKGRWDYKRIQILDKIKSILSSKIQNALFEGKTANQFFRMDRALSKSIVAIGTRTSASEFIRKLIKFVKLSKALKYGTRILVAAAAGATCIEMKNAETTTEKNSIMAEFLGGLVAAEGVSLAAGAALTLEIASGPIGWTVVLLAGAGTFFAGHFGAEKAKEFYDAHGNKYDLAGYLPIVNQLCY